MADERIIEPSVPQRTTVKAVIGSSTTSTRDGDFWRFGVKQRHRTLDAETPEADAGEWRKDGGWEITAVLESAADA